MRKTKDIIKYMILQGKTPEEVFKLIESARDYRGNDQDLWLASEIIKTAESEGIGYSQLLVKKLEIILSLREESETSVNQDWLDFLVDNYIGTSNIYSVGCDYLGSPLEDIEWNRGIDYNRDILGFSSQLPEGVLESLLNNQDLCIFAKLDDTSSDSKSDLCRDAKSIGITCNSNASLMVYRFITMARNLNLGSNFKFAFTAPIDFLYNPSNKSLINWLLGYYNCSGFVVSSSFLYRGAFLDERYAFVVCKPNGFADVEQDCISLDTYLGDKPVNLRYTGSSMAFRTYLSEAKPEGTPMGYLVFDRFSNVSISGTKVNENDIPITESNFKDVVIYYGLCKSQGTTGIPLYINGRKDIDSIFYNCLPIFLGVENTVNLGSSLSSSSDFIHPYLDRGTPYFSYEAKELLDTLSYISCSSSGVPIEKALKELNRPDISEKYFNSCNLCKKKVVEYGYI